MDSVFKAYLIPVEMLNKIFKEVLLLDNLLLVVGDIIKRVLNLGNSYSSGFKFPILRKSPKLSFNCLSCLFSDFIFVCFIVLKVAIYIYKHGNNLNYFKKITKKLIINYTPKRKQFF